MLIPPPRPRSSSDELPLPPDHIPMDIVSRAYRLNELATNFSSRIDSFEDWLNELPGKVPAEVFWDEDIYDDNDTAKENIIGTGNCALRFVRGGKRWILQCSFTRSECGPDVNWQPLAEAGVKAKLRASQHFPQLLEQIKAEQAKMTATLEAAHNEFETFAKTIGITAKKRAQ